MDQLNLKRLQFAPGSQFSQLQLELQRRTAPKPILTNLTCMSSSESVERARQMRLNLQQQIQQIPQQISQQIPQQQINLMQRQNFKQQVQLSNTMQRLQFGQQNVTKQKVIMHPPTFHQNAAQQFHLVQVQVPGKETQLQLIPFQTKSNTTNSEQCAATNRRYNKSSDAVNVSHEYVSENRQKHQTIYPSYFGARNSTHMPLLKPFPCPLLTPLSPPSFTSELVVIKKTIVPPTSQLLPLQEISMPKQTQFHQQLSNVINVLPPQNISLEEIDIKPDIIEQLHLEPDPSEFLKSFLSDPEVPQQKAKRKRKLKTWEMLLDDNKSEDDDDISHDYVEIKKQKRMSKDEKEEKRAKKIEKKNHTFMEMIRPCSVQVKKLMFTSMDMPVRIVNDNIVKIRMPRMKTVPTNYNKISNIGYIKYPKGIAYKCLLQTCRFQSYDEEVFEKHLINHHSQDAISEWTGYCCSCNDFVTAKTLIDEFDHLIEVHLETTKKVNRKKEQSAEELNAEALLAIKEVLDTFEEIVAEVDSVDEEASNAVDIARVSLEEETNVIKKKKCTEMIENKIKCRKDKEVKSKPEKGVKEAGTIEGRLISNRRKTIDSKEYPLFPRRSFRHSSNVLENEEKHQLPSVIVNSSNDGKIKMTIKNPTRFIIDKHKKKKDKKGTKNTFPLTPPESSSNCTDSDYSENSTGDDEIVAS